MKKPLKDFIPIYVSLAQTYADDKQYKNAILYYNKEIEARGDDATQVIKYRKLKLKFTENASVMLFLAAGL